MTSRPSRCLVAVCLARAIIVASALACACACAGCTGKGRVASRESTSLELILKIPGPLANGELGFRFGPPRDVDGDQVADVAAGARFVDFQFTQMGLAGVWSTASGRELRRWDGQAADALFGNAVVIGPDADGDARPDVVVSAPLERRAGAAACGVVYACSLGSGKPIWSAVGEPGEAFGWHVARAADVDHDGVDDVLAGAPGLANRPARVDVLSGRSGSTIRTFSSGAKGDLFGWHVASAADLDGDGLEDVLIGAPDAGTQDRPRTGAAYAFSSATGKRLHAWLGREPESHFGIVVAGLGDLTGDGVGEVAAGAPYDLIASSQGSQSRPGDVFVFSGASGEEVRHWTGKDSGELYGRMVSSAGDFDGDGACDVAVGAPWSAPRGMARAGRFEVRSGRTGSVLASVEGERPGMWLGWHIEPGFDIGRPGACGLVVSALRSDEGGLKAAGALLVYRFRRE